MTDDSKDDSAYRDLMSVIAPEEIWVQTKLKVSKSFEPHYNELLVELMSYGHTFAGACGRMGIPKSTGTNWCKEYPDWAEAKEIGEQVRQYHLEMALNFQATGRIHPKDLEDWQERNPESDMPKGDLRAIMFSLKTVHKDDYSEKTIHEQTTGETDAEKPKGSLNDELSKQLDTFRRSIVPSADRGRNAPGPRASKAKKKSSSKG